MRFGEDYRLTTVVCYDAADLATLEALRDQIRAGELTALVRLPASLTRAAIGQPGPRFWVAFVHGQSVAAGDRPGPAVWADAPTALGVVLGLAAARAPGEGPDARRN